MKKLLIILFGNKHCMGYFSHGFGSDRVYQRSMILCSGGVESRAVYVSDVFKLV
jgi:hypothetical protein